MFYIILNIFFRRLNSGASNAIDTAKLQIKNVVLNQWKLISVLKSYISKYTNDKIFENALNKEFMLFLQKIDPKVYGADLFKYFVLETKLIQKRKEEMKQNNSVLPSVINTIANKDKDDNKIFTPKWKMIQKNAVSIVSIAIAKLFQYLTK